MKNIVRVLAVLALFFSAFVTGGITAYGQFGPTEPIEKKGKVSLGVGYFYYSDKWICNGPAEWIDTKITINQPYVQASYGFMKNAEAYLRLGAGDFKAIPALISDPALSGFKSEFMDGLKPFITGGIKRIFNITPSLGICPFLEMRFYSKYKDLTTGTAYGSPATLEINFVRLIRGSSLGVVLQGKISKAILYVGPFYHSMWAFIEGKIASNTHSTFYSSTVYEEKNKFGGFLGARVPLGKAFILEVEGQMRSVFSGGASILYSF